MLLVPHLWVLYVHRMRMPQCVYGKVSISVCMHNNQVICIIMYCNYVLYSMQLSAEW